MSLSFMRQHLCVWRILSRKQEDAGYGDEDGDAPLLTSSNDVAALFG
jgi:hypothetical protein